MTTSAILQRAMDRSRDEPGRTYRDSPQLRLVHDRDAIPLVETWAPAVRDPFLARAWARVSLAFGFTLIIVAVVAGCAVGMGYGKLSDDFDIRASVASFLADPSLPEPLQQLGGFDRITGRRASDVGRRTN